MKVRAAQDYTSVSASRSALLRTIPAFQLAGPRSSGLYTSVAASRLYNTCCCATPVQQLASEWKTCYFQFVKHNAQTIYIKITRYIDTQPYIPTTVRTVHETTHPPLCLKSRTNHINFHSLYTHRRDQLSRKITSTHHRKKKVKYILTVAHIYNCIVICSLYYIYYYYYY
jgi:hypothetical protein